MMCYLLAHNISTFVKLYCMFKLMMPQLYLHLQVALTSFMFLIDVLVLLFYVLI